MTSQGGKASNRIFPGSSQVLEPTVTELEVLNKIKNKSVEDKVDLLIDQTIYAPK